MESRSSHNRRPLYGNGAQTTYTKRLAKRLTFFLKGSLQFKVCLSVAISHDKTIDVLLCRTIRGEPPSVDAERLMPDTLMSTQLMPGSIDAQEALLMPDSIDARLD